MVFLKRRNNLSGNILKQIRYLIKEFIEKMHARGFRAFPLTIAFLEKKPVTGYIWKTAWRPLKNHGLLSF